MARGAPPSSRAARTAAGRPRRTASRGVTAVAGVVAACVGVAFGFAFVLAFRTGAGLGFALGFGAARVVRDGVVDVATGRGAGGGLDGRETAGDGVAVAVLTTTGGFVATVVAEELTTGASGVGTARAGFEDVVGFADVVAFGDDVANPPGGSSGAGIGVPPAPQPAAGKAHATRQAPTASESRPSRRDDVHLDTYVPPFEGFTVRRSTHACQHGREWPPDPRRPPCPPCA